MKLTLEGKPEEIQDILSFIHLQQETYLAVKGVDSNNKPLIFNATTLNEMYGKIKNHTEELDKKMSMVNPKGSGNFNFGQNNSINNDSTNSIVVGQSLN